MKRLYIANWKMNMHYCAARSFCLDNYTRIIELSNDAEIIICPSFPVLQEIVSIFNNTSIKVGAQNCCAYQSGPYTGEVSIQSLQELGVSYCIVGHSERRTLFDETNEQIAKKIELLLSAQIIPIFCIGESKEEYENNKTVEILANQLAICAQLFSQAINQQSIIIAYEPVWSIGTGKIAGHDYLAHIFSWLRSYLAKISPKSNFRLVYGGSVNPENSSELKKIDSLDGFLIGNASTNFQTFEKIVSLL